MTAVYQMSYLPNAAGFRFIGIDRQRNEIVCAVRKNSAGLHSVYREDNGEPCYTQLIAWKHLEGES